MNESILIFKVKYAEEICGRLMDSPTFKQCHTVEDPHTYFQNCKEDVCKCEDDSCHCAVLEAYAKQCANKGRELVNWRNQTECRK